jgi:GNAT superfamily N-acetyltransferase
MNYQIRKGTKEDIPAALHLIKELAEYEKAPEEVTNTPEKMLEDGFGEHPVYWFFVAESEGKVAGMALFYIRYSTWKGRTIYLEDIIVTESHRGKGLGKLLLDEVVRETLAQNAAMLKWQVLDWNKPAIRFYDKFDTQYEPEWLNCKLLRSQMENWKYGNP